MNNEIKPTLFKKTENPYQTIPGTAQNENLSNIIRKHDWAVKVFMIFVAIIFFAITMRAFVYISNDEAHYTGGYIQGEFAGIQLNNVVGFVFIPLLMAAYTVLLLRKDMKKLYFSDPLSGIQRIAFWLARITIFVGILIVLYILWAWSHFSLNGLRV